MECSWMMGELLGPKLITHYSAIKEWNSLWRRQQLHFSSFNKFHSTKQRKVNFSFFLLNFICLHEDKWNEMKRKYYNSMLKVISWYKIILNLLMEWKSLNGINKWKFDLWMRWLLSGSPSTTQKTIPIHSLRMDELDCFCLLRTVPPFPQYEN